MSLVATDVAARGLDVEGVNAVMPLILLKMVKRTSIEAEEQQEVAPEDVIIAGLKAAKEDVQSSSTRGWY